MGSGGGLLRGIVFKVCNRKKSQYEGESKRL